MLYVRYDKRDKQQRTDYSAYISFNYNPFYVEKIRELPFRFWNPKTKEWEIPFNDVCRLYEFERDINFLNDIPEVEKQREIDLDNLEFKTPSFPYQLDGVKYGIRNKSWLLGDQQGLGKTKQMIDLSIWRKEHEGIKHVLVICGVNNLKYNWLEEIEKHSDEKGCVLGKRYVKANKEPSMQDRLEDLKRCPNEFFWITNIETLRCHKEGKFWKSEFITEVIRLINENEIGLIIVDEIHKCKNPSSAQGAGLLKLKGCNRIGLSGTLLVNKPLDLFVPLAFIEAIPNNYWQFQNKYVEKGYFNNVVGFKNMDELQQLMNIHMLRRTKDLLDLPPKITKNVLLEMSKEEQRLYDEILTATKKECDLIKNPTLALPKLLRMRQICCHTALVSSKVWKSSKFEALADILEEAKLNGEKVIVFSMFRELIKIALDEFKNYEPLHIWGQMDQLELQQQKDIFQKTPGFQVLFGQIQAAGTGHTLNEASIVVFLDLPWNRATMEQAEDRAHRIGTKKSVTIIKLIMKDTYDEVLDKMIISKEKMGDILVDGKDIKYFRRFLNTVFKIKGEDENEDI